MSMTVETGLPGVNVTPGDHVCSFYYGKEQRDEILLPYLRAGLAAGDFCLSIVDGAAPADLRSALAGERADHAQLVVLDPETTYLEQGRFDLERMMCFWDETARAAVRGGATLVRALGEMTWSLRDAPGVEQLLTYEARLNSFLPRYPQVILCLYDLERFSGSIVMGMLGTHPLVLMNGSVWRNPYYLPPHDFLDERR